MSKEKNVGEVAASIDTPEFRDLAHDWGHAIWDETGDGDKDDGKWAELVSHIDARLARQAAPHTQAEPVKMTARDGIWWPEGYCRDPNGNIVAPAGKHTDFKFGVDIGYAEGLIAHRTSVAAIENSILKRQAAPHAPSGSVLYSVPRYDLVYGGYVSSKDEWLQGEWVKLDDLKEALAAAPAAPHAQAEPVGKVTVVDGLWSSVSHLQHKPMPDGEHELYAVPVPQEAEQAAPAAVTDASDELLDMLGRIHPFAMERAEREKAYERLERAFVIQQPWPVPDQACIVWRADLMDMRYDLVHKQACFDSKKEQPATPAVTDAARDVLADAKGGA